MALIFSPQERLFFFTLHKRGLSRIRNFGLLEVLPYFFVRKASSFFCTLQKRVLFRIRNFGSLEVPPYLSCEKCIKTRHNSGGIISFRAATHPCFQFFASKKQQELRRNYESTTLKGHSRFTNNVKRLCPKIRFFGENVSRKHEIRVFFLRHRHAALPNRYLDA